MKEVPLFSVIVPIYNIEKFLVQCINSIINQTFKNYELILVDDGSKDNCPAICDEFRLKYDNIVVIHKKNGGLVSARQAGAKKARGKYIICVDGDDWISKDYLLKFYSVIEKFNPDIVCCGSIWAYEDRNVDVILPYCEGFYNRNKIEKDIFPSLIESEKCKYFAPSLWAKAFKKDMYLESQLKVSQLIKIGEDHACSKPCIYNSSSIYILNDCLYFYRQNVNSMTKNKKAFDWNMPYLIAKHMEKNLPVNEFDFQKQIYRQYVHNLFNVSLSQFNRKDNYRKIKKEILEHFDDDYCKKSILNCSYSLKGWKGLFAKFSIKHKLVLLIYIYNKIFT